MIRVRHVFGELHTNTHPQNHNKSFAYFINFLRKKEIASFIIHSLIHSLFFYYKYILILIFVVVFTMPRMCVYILRLLHTFAIPIHEWIWFAVDTPNIAVQRGSPVASALIKTISLLLRMRRRSSHCDSPFFGIFQCTPSTPRTNGFTAYGLLMVWHFGSTSTTRTKTVKRNETGSGYMLAVVRHTYL